MSEHRKEDWMGASVCSRCYLMPEPGSMKPEPWPCPTVQLAAAHAREAALRERVSGYEDLLSDIITRIEDGDDTAILDTVWNMARTAMIDGVAAASSTSQGAEGRES